MPSTSLPVYVMLPLDTIWLLERDEKSVRTITTKQILMAALRCT